VITPPPPAPAESTAALDPASSTKPAAAGDSERVKAEAARARLGELKQARAASTAPLPVRMRNEAVRFERQGSMAFANADYARASVMFEEASRIVALRPDRPGRIGGPGGEASSSAAAPSTSASAASPGTPPPSAAAPDTRTPAPPPARKPVDTTPFESRSNAPAPPGRPVDPSTIRTPPRESNPDISTFNRTAPATVDQMFNAAPSARATIARITMLIEQYAKAMEQRDGETLRSVRTELTPMEQRIVRHAKQVSYKLDNLNVQSDGSEGLATARRTATAEFESGEKFSASGQVTIRLVRRPAGWVITEIR
jgi:hypothetical protein